MARLVPKSEPAEIARPTPFEWSADAPPPAIAPFDAEQARQHQQAWADTLSVPAEKEIVVGQNADGEDATLAMVLIPSGEFPMGSTAEEQDRFLEQADAEQARKFLGKSLGVPDAESRIVIWRNNHANCRINRDDSRASPAPPPPLAAEGRGKHGARPRSS